MAPIDYIPRTTEMYSDYAPYRWVFSEDVPWTPITRPVAQSRVALVTSGGVHLVDQEPFHMMDDTSLREIPKKTQRSDLTVSHFGYLIDDAKADPNCVFPLDRMRELEAEGIIGELSDPAYSFMGGIYSARRVRQEVCPDLVDRLKRDRIDLLFLVPA